MRSVPRIRPTRRVWRALLSALAGGGLTAAGLAGPLSGEVLGASRAGAGSATEASSTPVVVTEGGTATSESPPGAGQSTTPTTITTTTTTPATTTPTTTTTTPTETSTGPLVVAPAPSGTAQAPAVARQRQQKITPAAESVSGAQGQTPAGANAANPGANNVAPAPQLIAAQAGVLAAELAGSAASAQALSYYRIPLFLLPIYQAAAAQYGVPWQILAAINEIETDYGNDLSVSTAGAVGWMQFMPATWIQYGVDALNAGYADPYNPVDAIFAAARYLRAAGASSNLRAAILAYNHSAEYVSSVLLRAKLISSYPNAVIATLTGLTDGRLPVRNNRVAWNSIAHLVSPSSATAQATAIASAPSASREGGASQPSGSAAKPVGGVTATAASRAPSPSSPAPQLVDLTTSPNATVVAVQDGRVVKIGSSHKLGSYVVLRDVYGDVFTYAGLGRIASSYRLPKAPRAAGVATSARAPSAGAATAAEASAATAAEESGKTAAGHRAPITLKVKAPAHARAAKQASAAANPNGESPSAGIPSSGKVRLFAHPENPDALASAGGRTLRTRPGYSPLRRGSIVAKGTVLGHVSTPPGARAGHLRFAIRPAGDLETVDPRPILQNWTQLGAALHPQGANGETELLGATASGVFLLSKSDLERDVLSDPGITIPACGRHEISSGAIDRRVLAVLAFLSRSGLKPTVSAVRCDHSEYAVSEYDSEHAAGAAVDISAVDGIPIASHQGPGTITDVTIRTLLTLTGHFSPLHIGSLMHYPSTSNTVAMAEQWDHIHIGFRPARPRVPLSPAATAAAHSAKVGRTASLPLFLGSELSAVQWNSLITHVGALSAPKVSVKPSTSAIPDKKHP